MLDFEPVTEREAYLNRHRVRMFLDRNKFKQLAEDAEFELRYQRQKYCTMFATLLTIIFALAGSLAYVVFF